MSEAAPIPKVSAERFTIVNWECNVWSRFDVLFSETLDKKIMSRKIAEAAIGWCESNRLSVRPRREPYWVAVLCEDKDGVFWFHERREVLDMADAIRRERK